MIKTTHPLSRLMIFLVSVLIVFFSTARSTPMEAAPTETKAKLIGVSDGQLYALNSGDRHYRKDRRNRGDRDDRHDSDNGTYLEDLGVHTSTWMTEIFDLIGGKILPDITIPGSHDSAMHYTHYCTEYANSCNTQTQTTNIGQQLMNGVRYFDLRPYVESDDYVCFAHYGKVGSVYHGCSGECSYSVFKEINGFFDDPTHQKELVILDVSHCFVEWWHENGRYAQQCGNGQLNVAKRRFETGLSDHLVKFNESIPADTKLKDLPLTEILELGNIIVLMDGMPDSRTLKESGIFVWDDLPTVNEYSNTNDYYVMKNDQFNKLCWNDWIKERKMFVLSWTLTLNSGQAAECYTWPTKYWAKSILDLAEEANGGKLWDSLYRCDPCGHQPNVLFVDHFTTAATHAAVNVNQNFGKRQSVDTVWESNTDGHSNARCYMRNDGNLVIYDQEDKPLWMSGTAVHPGATLAMQLDGNLVIYEQEAAGEGLLLWSTPTAGHPGATYRMQDDGNFVIYDVDGTVLWETGTDGHPGAYYEMQDDGDLVIKEDYTKQVWSTGTGGHPGADYRMREDGNFVIYDVDGTVLWETGTDGHPGADYRMQDDGNFVIVDRNGVDVLWSSGTAGHPGARYLMQDDGNFVINYVDGKVLWSSGTAGTTGGVGGIAAMHHDGLFGIYHPSKKSSVLWETGTGGYHDTAYEMRDDGNLVVYERLPHKEWVPEGICLPESGP